MKFRTNVHWWSGHVKDSRASDLWENNKIAPTATPWSKAQKERQSLILVHVWMLKACAENVHDSYLSLDIYGPKTAPSRAVPTEINWTWLLDKVCITALSLYLPVCNSPTSLFSSMPQLCFLIQLYSVNMLSLQSATCTPSESPVHPTPAFLCVRVFVFSSFPCWSSQVCPWSWDGALHVNIVIHGTLLSQRLV